MFGTKCKTNAQVCILNLKYSCVDKNFSIKSIYDRSMLMLCHPGCMDGFIGRNCNVKCPPPSYGPECQLECKCQPSVCHHVFGCRRSESGKRLRTI